MIVVIADDLSGAAELAGLGLRYNLKVEMNMDVNPSAEADLLVIATDTRSMTEEAAVKEMERVTRATTDLSPSLLYKKVDSVLRGHVLAELNVQLKTLGLEKALLVPANPALGRTMVNGIYYYNDHPIHLSSFSKDPEFAIKSSKVLEMLRANGGNVKLTNKSVSVEGPGVYVGEAANEGDLHHWANIHEKDMLAVGGSGFFRALLAHHLPATKLGLKKTVKKPGKLSLFVCGSTFSKSRANIKHIHTNGGPVNYIPVVQDPVEDDSYQEWIDETVSLIKSNCTAIIAINESAFSELTVSALELREKTAHLVSGILKKVKVNELYIEGGSTAAAVIRKLGYTIFTPVEELAPGVIRMAINGNPKLCVTVKPGSYNWPDNVWKF